MKRIYRASDLPQAYLIRQQLENAGIPCRILNENAQGGVGEIPFTHTYPEIWLVRDTDTELAQKFLREFEENQRKEIGSVTCPSCGEPNPANFETCWKCAAVLSLP